MIEWINGWAQGIIVALVIATIIEMLLPNGKNKRYVKTIIGIYIMFTVISPIITNFTNIKIDFKNIDDYFETNSLNINTIQISNNTIEQTYRSKLNKDIKEKMKEKGYKVLDVEFKINVNDEKNYGTLESVSLKVHKVEITDDDSNELKSINKIQSININIGNSNDDNLEIKEKISEFEKKDLVKYIEEIYGIDKEKIYIN